MFNYWECKMLDDTECVSSLASCLSGSQPNVSGESAALPPIKRICKQEVFCGKPHWSYHGLE